jgi:hypothetical protein
MGFYGALVLFDQRGSHMIVFSLTQQSSINLSINSTNYKNNQSYYKSLGLKKKDY